MAKKINDGDMVVITKPCRVDQYWYDPSMIRGSYDFMFLLPGLTGKVVHARTPCASYNPKIEPPFFANVDVEYMGKTWRVREFHDHFKRL